MKRFRFFASLITTLLVVSACGNNNVNPGDEKEEVKPVVGNLKFNALDGEREIPFAYYENLFFESSNEFRPELRKFSYDICLAAAIVKEENRNPTDNIETFLSTIGYKDFVTAGYEHNDKNSIGSFFARKEVKYNEVDYNIVIVTMESMNYKIEWIGNFLIGSEGDHYGFATATEVLKNRLLTYVNDYNINLENTKLLLTGYSRGGAVMNVLGGNINKAIEGTGVLKDSVFKNMKNENLFTYTFATPNAVTVDSKNELLNQNNIFNTVIDADLITYFVPNEENSSPNSGYGMTRYGTDMVFSTADKEINAKVKDKYESYGEHAVEYLPQTSVIKKYVSSLLTFKIDEVSSEERINIPTLYSLFLKKLSSNSSENGGALFTRDKLDGLKDILSWAGGIYFNLSKEELETYKPLLLEKVQSIDAFTMFQLLLEIGAINTLEDKTLEDISGIRELFLSILEIIEKNDEENIAILDANLLYLVYVLNGIVNAFSADLVAQSGSIIITLISNMSSTIVSHYPEVYLAWIDCAN